MSTETSKDTKSKIKLQPLKKIQAAEQPGSAGIQQHSSKSRIQLQPLKKIGSLAQTGSANVQQHSSKSRIQLQPLKKISPVITQAKTELGHPAVKINEAQSTSITDMINESVGEHKARQTLTIKPVKRSSPSNDYLVADDSVQDLPEIQKMECLECGANAEVEAGVETARCGQCGGTMYPVDLFNGEDTLAYADPLSDPVVSPLIDKKKTIKVAQPVNVGMFSSTTTGKLNKVASSPNLNPSEFFTSSRQQGSMTSKLASLAANPGCSPVTAEILTEISRERKKLTEEKSRLKQEQADFEQAIADFEEKSKELEQLRLELELKDATSRLPLQESLMAHSEPDQEDDIIIEEEEQWNISLIVIIVLSILVVLQSAALVYLLFFKK
jgi:hypothetical protein